MKPSEVYRKAAMRIERGRAHYICEAISDVNGKHGFAYEEDHPLLRLFKPRRMSLSGGYWDHYESAPRILALCFMAAIAEDEERSRKRRS